MSVGVALALVGSLGFWIRYPGLTRAARLQVIDGGFAETRNATLSLVYWAEYLGMLTPNEATGQLDFAAVRAARSSPGMAARLAFHDGEFGASIARFEDLIAGRKATRDDRFWLGLSQFRSSEQHGCLEGARSELAASCALPLPARTHRPQATAAAETFSSLFAESDDDATLMRWLRLLSLLAGGTGYDQLSADEHIERTDEYIDGPLMDLFYGSKGQEIAGAHAGWRLVDRAHELGVDTFDAGKGVAVEDFDGDGDLDLVTGGSFDRLRYYENRVGRFIERSAEAGFGGIVQPHILTTADFDGDGRMDLFVGSLLQPDRLLRNLGGGRFADVTESVGLAAPPGVHTFSWTSAWADVDLDGDLDLFVARWGIRAPGVKGVLARPRADSILYLAQDGHFDDVTESMGVAPFVTDAALLGAAFGDADGDGDPDLFLSSPTRRGSVLLRNEGDRFALEQRFDTGFGAAFVDFDHDGRLEILQTGLSDARTSVQAAVYGRQIGAPATGRTRLFRRRVHRSTDPAAVASRWAPVEGFLSDELPIGTMGSSYGDLDNDGCFEIYLGTGSPEPWFLLPNLLYSGRREDGACRLGAENVSMLPGFASIQKGHGIVFFDFDGDGDEDMISSLGGMWPGDRWPNQLFVNESADGGHWIELRLRGRRGNRHGLGAAIRVVARRPDGRELVRTAGIDGKTGFGSGPLLAHIGLFDAVAVESVEVRWPVSGCVGEYQVPLDSRAVLDEADCEDRAQVSLENP